MPWPLWPVIDVPVERCAGLAGAEQGERFAFPAVLLPAVGGQLVRAEPFGEAAERAAGVDLRELLEVADQDDFRPVAFGDREDPFQHPGADHPGLIHDEDGVRRESAVVGVFQVTEEPGQGRGLLDPAAVGEFPRRPGRGGPAEHPVAGGLPTQAGSRQRRRLPGPRGGCTTSTACPEVSSPPAIAA
jgi:hypothetical protein